MAVLNTGSSRWRCANDEFCREATIAFAERLVVFYDGNRQFTPEYRPLIPENPTRAID
jgi:hypothetical protein